MVGLGAGVKLHWPAPVFHVGTGVSRLSPGFGAGAGSDQEWNQEHCTPERSMSSRAHGPVTPEPITYIRSDDSSTTTRSRNPPSKTNDAERTSCLVP
jgi:hypothetical protein